jgi:trimethylguanosine synthase
VIIDCFAGAGGNAIAFALSGRWNQIFAVEKDAKTLACAKHNAEVYGVAKKIFWIHGDIFEQLDKRLRAAQKKAVVFGSPPWGGVSHCNGSSEQGQFCLRSSGPTYSDYEVFDLDMMQPYSLKALYEPFAAISTHVVLFLPRTSDLKQIAQYGDQNQKLRIMHYCMYGASKALCVFYGEFAME